MSGTMSAVSLSWLVNGLFDEALDGLRNESVNFHLRLPYLLMDLCELGTENLHITPFCKYQINQNRSSGSHIIVQGAKEKIE